jgi:hypothetical protein
MILRRIFLRGASKRLVLIILSLIALQLLAYPEAMTSSYASTNIGMINIQTTYNVSGGALDPTGRCVRHADYNNHHSEGWIAVDPTNSRHLVGVSKFFFNPQFYLFHTGTMISRDAGRSWRDGVLPGFDCRSSPDNSWSDTTDPVIAFDSQGAVYSVVLAFNHRYNSRGDTIPVSPADEIAVVKSADGGVRWAPANQGNPLLVNPSSDVISDKPWIAADSNPHSPFADYVYVAWTVIDANGGNVVFSRSADQGQHFSRPIPISNITTIGNYNTEAFVGSGPDGTLYAAFTSFPDPNTTQADVWVLDSKDGGLSFSRPRIAATFLSPTTPDRPNTTFREYFADSFAVDPSNGHLLLAIEVDSGSGLDVYLTISKDGGHSWSQPVPVNDPSTVMDGTDQFQPTVAAAANGIMAVTFYDRRLPCPFNDQNILSADAGRANFCINTSIQFYKDGRDQLEILGSNIRVSKATWDPQNPGITTDQLPRPGGPKSNETFIGDYFGLALTTKSAYVLFTSNYNLGRNPANNQEQVLGIIPLPEVEHGDNQYDSGSNNWF